jgi:hypothetical protein
MPPAKRLASSSLPSGSDLQQVTEKPTTPSFATDGERTVGEYEVINKILWKYKQQHS